LRRILRPDTGGDGGAHMLQRNAGRAGKALDALNFFLADVRDGLGPYLAIFLLTIHHWDAASIGTVMSVAGVMGIVAQAPAGALVDWATAKRAVVVSGAVLVTATSLLVPLVDGRVAIATLQGLSAVAAAVFPPAIAAITLGIFKPKAFPGRMGRNEAFNHAGNATAAAAAALLAYSFGPIVVFWLMAAMAVGTIAATLAIPADAIDNRVARGLNPSEASETRQSASWRAVLADRDLRIFALAMVAFHFANAAMLPLAGQKLALLNPTLATSLMAACIVAAQIIMVPVAYLTGQKCDAWGRKPIFLAAFAVLTVRGLLYPISDSLYWIVGVQLLDGVGAGIFGALFPVVVADITHGQGHFNAALGGIAAAAGLGGALSTLVAGFIVVMAGYSAAFLSLAGIAAAGFALYLVAMPETGTKRAAEPSGPAAPLSRSAA